MRLEVWVIIAAVPFMVRVAKNGRKLIGNGSR